MKQNFYPRQNAFLRVAGLLVFALMLSFTTKAQCTYYLDSDGDGFGDPSISYFDPVCDPPIAGYVADGNDCDDALLTYSDNDGDGFGALPYTPCGTIDNSDCYDNLLTYSDNDGDGFGALPYTPCGTADNSDCDDNLLTYSDNDGDGFGALPYTPCGTIDNSDCDDNLLTYSDNDGDGFGALPYTPCGITDNSDCDDNLLTYSDNDGDGFGALPYTPCGITDNTDCDDNQLLYEDADGDGYGARAAACGIADNTDCDDSNPAVNPGATEICNGIDDDCDGLTDEGFVTYSKGSYHTPNSVGGAYLFSHFDAVFPGDFVVGCTYTLNFSSANDVYNFLPSGGPSKVLTQNYFNPTSRFKNTFASQVTTLKLTLAFDASDEAFTPINENLADLYIVGGTFNGWTVQQVFDEAERKLGGCASAYTVNELNNAITAINENFDGGANNGYLSCSPGGAPKTVREYNDEAATETTIHVYPNPTQGETTVEFYVSYDQEFTLQLVDLTGRVVFTSNTMSALEGVNKYNLNLQDVAKGLYILNRHNSENITTSTRIAVK